MKSVKKPWEMGTRKKRVVRKPINKTTDNSVEITDICGMDMADLVIYEKAVGIIRNRYENAVSVHGNIIDGDSSDYYKFRKYNDIYLAIIAEMENKISKIEI